MAGRDHRTLLLLGVSAALLLSACNRPAANATTGAATKTAPAGNNLDAAPAKSAALEVQTVSAKPGSLSLDRSASGTVKSSRDSNVAAQASGAVQRVLAQVGDNVTAGQIIIQLDDTSLRQSLKSAQLQLQNAQINLDQASRNTGQNVGQLQAALTSAQANLSKAQQTAAANRNLYSLGGISKADLTASEAALAQAQSEVAQARNSLAQNGSSGTVSIPLLQNQVAQAQSSVQSAQNNLSHTAIRAPFAGVIATLPLSVGEYVQTGTTAFRLVDTSALSVDFSVSPSDAASLTTGTALNLSYGSQKLTGRVKEGDRVAGTDRLVPISVRLDSTGSKLPVGASVQVRYRVKLGGGLSVPAAAIQQTGGSNVVFVAQNSAARQTPVNIVAESGETAVVTGLNEGDQVINPIPPSLADGSAVTVSQAGAQSTTGTQP
ncbi:efflux RND transporter periplasmic adaptor subunit [Deinococcus sp. KNUC1210]|uniref:efflux RND transporter periplasmic adaptor subunit n=1 Tax=Deinococcus sp. KNUC1210 TaxID=2917691 RepID=UPI001EF06C31|nr:efflux RND transporter periplasmic adaptor subunit [Deinococcus sp. KNUC1210]ULH15468.1 efflux RND transporter periplasmic adaptor subunit [Deinococcus sp. KNUC1210]